MMTVIRPLLLGSLLCLVLGSCRTDSPPPKEICILDGFGGGDCIESDGSKLYRPPSQMINYWSTNQPDIQAFVSWCYNIPLSSAAKKMEEINDSARAHK